MKSLVLDLFLCDSSDSIWQHTFTSLHIRYFNYLKNMHAHFGQFINDLEADHSCLSYSVMVSHAVSGCTYRLYMFGFKVVHARLLMCSQELELLSTFSHMSEPRTSTAQLIREQPLKIPAAHIRRHIQGPCIQHMQFW